MLGKRPSIIAGIGLLVFLAGCASTDSSETAVKETSTTISKPVANSSAETPEKQSQSQELAQAKSDRAVVPKNTSATPQPTQPKRAEPAIPVISVGLITASITVEYSDAPARMRVMVGTDDPDRYSLICRWKLTGKQWQTSARVEVNNSYGVNPVLSNYYFFDDGLDASLIKQVEVRVKQDADFVRLRLPDGRVVDKWLLKITGEDQGTAWFGYSSDESSVGN